MSVKTKIYNDELHDVFGELHDIMMSIGEPFRARAYKKTQETILNTEFKITKNNYNGMKGKPGIGTTIFNKIQEYIETGKLNAIEKEKGNPIFLFTKIYGVGPKKAYDLVKKYNIKSIQELREYIKNNKKDKILNDKQLLGLKYYEDILKRIPRDEIDKYNKIFKKIMKTVCNEKKICYMEIVGSYRRGANNSGDIDVILSNEEDDINVFYDFLDECIKRKIIIEVLSRGKTKSLVIGKLGYKDDEYNARRIDFLFTSREEYPFSKLYFTGSASFNTVMRKRAMDIGYTMNEHGIYKMNNKKKGEKVNEIFNDEEDIFKFLGMKYKKPNERINGNDVVLLENTEDDKTHDDDNYEDVIFKCIKHGIKLEIADKDTEKQVLLNVDLKDGIDKIKQGIKKVSEFNEKIKKKTKTETTKNTSKETKTDMKKEEAKKITKTTLKNELKKFASSGIDYLNKHNQKELSRLLLLSNELYYNNKPLLTDEQYDILKEYIEKKYPNEKALKEIGAPVEVQKDKVKLPYFMGSMDKIKPNTDALKQWKDKYNGPYVVSTKLDGVSALYVVNNGDKKLYTRGNGIYGQDITHLISLLKLPSYIPSGKSGKKMNDNNFVLRGEIIMKKKIFNTKYRSSWSNPRNLISGLVNSKTLTQSVKELCLDSDFVCYEIIKPEMGAIEQFNLMDKIEGLKICEYKIIKSDDLKHNELTNEYLSGILVKWREQYKYEIDGIIITNDGIYKRKNENPKHSLAFKMVLSDQIVEAKVIDVIWTASKDGYLKPRIRIEPVTVGGVVIEYATAFNAGYVRDNNIGIGTVIQLIRAGDVIPHILDVIKQSDKPKMPDVDYKWNDTNVDIILTNINSDPDVLLKNITRFFTTLKIKGFNKGNVKKIIDSGYDTIESIIKMKKDDFLKIPGFKNKMSSNMEESLKKGLENVDIIDLMVASNIFGRGFGKIKLEPIITEYPCNGCNILNTKDNDVIKTEKISKLDGFSIKSAALFVFNLSDFKKFLKKTGLRGYYNNELYDIVEKTGNIENVKITDNKDDKKTNKLLDGLVFVITGFRSSKLEKFIKLSGGKVVSTVSKKTNYIIVKDENTKKTGSSNKLIKGKELGIGIITNEEFNEKYKI